MENQGEGFRMVEDKEKATDMEAFLFYSRHIDKPCEVEVPGKDDQSVETVNIRDFYIRGAKEALLKMTNPEAKKLLEQKIAQYEGIE